MRWKRRRSCERCSRMSRRAAKKPPATRLEIGIRGGASAPGASETRVTITRISAGAYRVEHDGRSDLVYAVRDSRDVRWAFWNGRVFRMMPVAETAAGGAFQQPLTAPMPATVLRVLVAPGSAVKKGDSGVLPEARKMERPIRAPADATVTAAT